MAPRRDQRIEHLLRRAGFGGSPEDLTFFIELGYRGTLEYLLDYENAGDIVDTKVGQPGYLGITTRGEFLPNRVINDARQRWMFRMVHTERPLQEKMTLFWHNHFATAYSKISGIYGGEQATRMMAAVPAQDPGKVEGQIELLRRYALGNFRDLLIAIAKDVAMLVWLDGRTNTRTRPQENFGRELMELFTTGVGYHTESDVYAAARVFTGWNLRSVGSGNADPTFHYEFIYNAGQHDVGAKTFSFPIYADGNQTIPGRSASDGMQDGLDLINALARHPETGRRLVGKLWKFFISEMEEPDPGFVDQIASTYYANNFEMKPVIRQVLQSAQFQNADSYFARYGWPVEFVVRALKEVGPIGFSANDTLTPLVNMGQQLFEPPDVNGWELGPGWFSSGAMLARMNFAAQLSANQRFNLRDATRPYRQTPEAVLSYFLDRLSPMSFDNAPYGELLSYLRAGSAWSGSDAQLQTKAAGLVHLIVGSSEYQFV
jgi:uncharacterized protein (DUF1800 family)